MLRFASSDDHFVLVGVNSGAGADFSRAEERILHLATLANGAGAVATLIIVVDPDAELPEAVWRKRLAEARAHSSIAICPGHQVQRGARDLPHHGVADAGAGR